ncbi:MAG TPA: hypothetical protein ENH00_04005 [Actinobacteria bacterium]|nr:hypothetical protein BMS3Bbin01_01298 [bacterium BMS3Bbin01]HDH25346.1 hypothetical protein [Actinomycetota bacterium]
MYRRTGIILVIVAVVLSAWMLTTPVRHFTGYLIGGGETEKLFTTCGKTIDILSGRFDEEVTTPGARGDCVKEARGRVAYVVIVAPPLLLVAGFAIARGRYPNLPLP